MDVAYPANKMEALAFLQPIRVLATTHKLHLSWKAVWKIEQAKLYDINGVVILENSLLT